MGSAVVAAGPPSQLIQALLERGEIRTFPAAAAARERADTRDPVGRLRTHRERPRDDRAAEKNDELSSLQPIEMHPLPLAGVTA